MPANSINDLQSLNQSSGAERKADSQLFAPPAASSGARFGAVLRDVRRPGSGQDIAPAAGKNLPPGAELHQYALGPRVKIITSSDPAPDDQSLIAFARAEGIDGALLKLIMGKKAVPAASADSSVPDPAGPVGAAGWTLAMSSSDLVLASIALAAEPVRAPIPQLNALAATDTITTTSRPGFVPSAGAWAASPALMTQTNAGAPASPLAPDALARPAVGSPTALAAANTNAGAPELPLAPDALARRGIGTASIATAAAPGQSGPKSSGNGGVSVEPMADLPNPAEAVRRSPELPLLSATAVLNGARTHAVAATAAPSVQGKPVDVPEAAAKSIEGPAAPLVARNEAPANASEAPPGLTQAVRTDAPKTPADAGQAVPDQTATDAPASDGKGSPGPLEPTRQGAVQGEQLTRKEALYEHLAMLVRPENQKSGKSRSDENQAAALLGVDAPATVAEQPHLASENAINPVSAAAADDNAKARSGAAADLDLSGAAPAHEESMQDAHFRRSEQYQLLSDRVAEAIGQRLSAQIAKGMWQANLQLNPSHLGKIDIRLSMRGSGTIDAEFNASQPHTQDLLLNGLPRLKEIMAESGVELARTEVKHEGASAHGGNPRARQSLPAASPVELSSLQAPAAQSAPHIARIGADGLDVLV